MRIYEEAKYRSMRKRFSKAWHHAIANWLADSLGDIYNDDEMLSLCYAAKRSNISDEEEYPKIIYDYVKYFRNKNRLSQLFVIYGPPGIGKTSYVSNLLNICFPHNFKCDIYPIFFDLRNVSDFRSLSKKFIDMVEDKLNSEFFIPITKDLAIYEQLLIYIEMFKDKLSGQIIGFDKNDYTNTLKDEKIKEKVNRIIEERYLSDSKLACIRKIDYICKKNDIDIVFIIDNYDHNENYEEVHKSIYDLAKEILFDFGRPVFIPMRNYTFYDSYDRYGYMEADNYRNKSLSAPIHKELFKRRKEYILSKVGDKIRGAFESGLRFDINPDIIKKELSLIMNGIELNVEVMEFLEGISGDNMRVYLDLILNAIQSGHLEYSQRNDGTVFLSYKSFLKACAFCNNTLFLPTEKRSPIINLFDNLEEEGRNNFFIRIRVLQDLKQASSPVAAVDIIRELGIIGYKPESVVRALGMLRSSGLLDESPYYKANKMIRDQNFILSSTGKHYLNSLALNPAYFELMLPSCNLPGYVKNDLEKIINHPEETREHRKERLTALLNLINLLDSWERKERENIKDEISRIDSDKYYMIIGIIKRAVQFKYTH